MQQRHQNNQQQKPNHTGKQSCPTSPRTPSLRPSHRTPVHFGSHSDLMALTNTPTAGKLIGNKYGTPAAAHIYTDELHQHLRNKGYQQIKPDPYLFIKRSHRNYILLAVSMEDFLSAASTPQLNDAFYRELTAKHKVKRLGKPTTYLNCPLSHHPQVCMCPNTATYPMG